jgi:Tol biopolymer transport system component
MGEKGIYSLRLVNVETSEIRIIRTNLPSSRIEFGLSPNGNFLAYHTRGQGSETNDIFVCDVATSKETCVVQNPAEDRFLGWSADGRYVIFQSDRNTTPGIWAVRFEPGKELPSAISAKTGLGWVSPLGFNDRGDFYYRTTRGASDIYVAEVDFSSGHASSPRKLSQVNEGLNDNCDFSPDGRHIAYARSGGTATGGTPDAICVLSMDTGKYREYPTKPKNLSSVWHLTWLSDNESVIFHSWDATIKQGSLNRLNIDTGEIRTVVEKTEANDYLLPSGDAVIFHRQVAGTTSKEETYRTFRTFRRDLASGAEIDLFTGERPFPLALSRDGQYLAFTPRESGIAKTIVVVPTKGGTNRVLEFEGGYAVGWTADGKSLLVSKRGQSPNDQLWRIPLDGGPAQKTDLSMPAIYSITPHPDGKRIAFRSRLSGGESQVWVMENFLPTAATAGKK